jgi:hypothetical protein
MSNEIAVKEKKELQSKKNKSEFSEKQIKKSRLDTQNTLPDLAQCKKHFVPLSVQYWSPQDEGEEKLVYVHSVGMHDVPDLDTGEIKALECVMLIEKQGNIVMRYINAGRVLVGNIKDAIKRDEIIPGTTLTPISITYVGKKKNRSNAHISNVWQIIPLISN